MRALFLIFTLIVGCTSEKTVRDLSSYAFNLQNTNEVERVNSILFENNFKCKNHKTHLTCRGFIPNYKKEIAIIVKNNFIPENDLSLIVYFHGNNAPNRNLDYYFSHYQIDKNFLKTNRNSILIVPSSGSGKDSQTFDFDNNFALKENFEANILFIVNLLTKAGFSHKPIIEKLTLMSHSGGYRSLKIISNHQSESSGKFFRELKEVYILDGLYGGFDEFAKYIMFDKTRRFWSVYNKNNGLQKEVACFMNKLRSLNYNSFFGCSLSNDKCEDNTQNQKEFCKYLPSSDDYKLNNVGFIPSEDEHEDIGKNYFSKMLIN